MNIYVIINYSGYFRVIGEITKTGRRVVTIRLMSDEISLRSSSFGNSQEICVKRKKRIMTKKKVSYEIPSCSR